MVKNLTTKKYLLEKSDYSKYQDLFFYSFEDPKTETEMAFLKREFERSNVYGLKNDEELMVSVTCVPFKVNFFGKEFKMAGIANVMSAPEYLPSDGVSTLMDQAFNDMRQSGTVLSYLGPFSFDYYRRFGYEQVFENLEIKLPFEKLLRYKKPSMGHLKKYQYNSASEIIGDLFIRENTSGTVIRKPWWWKNISLWYPDDMLAVFYDESDEINGYLRYNFENGDFIIRDMYYRTPDGFLGLMHFVNKHRSIYQNIIINSADINLRVNDFVSDPNEAEVKIKPSMMARIVDLKQFLLDYPLQITNLDTIYLEVGDTLPWNNHIWAMSIKNGEMSLEKAEENIPEVIVDIQTLTKAMFGYQSLKASYDIGNVLGNVDKVEELSRIFVNKRAQLKDTF